MGQLDKGVISPPLTIGSHLRKETQSRGEDSGVISKWMITLKAVGWNVIIPGVCEKWEKYRQFWGTIEGKELPKRIEKEWPDR